MKPHDDTDPAEHRGTDAGRRSLFAALFGTAVAALGCRGGGARSAQCPPYDPKAAKQTFDGRVGAIVVSNRSAHVVTVAVYHPDGDGTAPEETWRVAAASTLELGNGFGNDWGIRVDASCVPTVGSVAEWDGAAFRFGWDGRDFVRPSVDT